MGRPKGSKNKPVPDILGNLLSGLADKAPVEMLDFSACVGLVYISQAPQQEIEHKLIHGCQTILAYRQLTKQSSSELQTAVAGAWIAGIILDYEFWILNQNILYKVYKPDVIASIASERDRILELPRDQQVNALIELQKKYKIE